MNDAGKISLVPKGAYSADVMYEALDVVKHDGMAWVAKKSTKGITPVEGDYWMCLVTAAGYATAEAPGIVRPDNTTIEVDSSGGINVSTKALTFSDHDTSEDGISFSNAEDGNMLVTDWTRNLLNPELESIEVDGITCTKNGDGTFTINGTASKNVGLIVKSNIYDYIGKKICGCPKNGGAGKYLLYISKYDKDWNFMSEEYDYGDGFISNESNKSSLCHMLIYVYSGYTCDNLVFKPMLTTDLSATYDDFVPYSGYEIKSCGRNLLNPELDANGSIATNKVAEQNGITCIDNGDGTYKLNGTATAYCSFGLDRNQKLGYSINGKTCKITGTKSDVGAYVGIYERAAVNSYRDYGNGATFVYDKSKLPEVIIEVLEGKTLNNVVLKPMITTDLSATYDTFEKYQGESITVTNDTESPAFGLKSHSGLTHIIAPGNVKAVYPTNEKGTEITKAMSNTYEKARVAILMNDRIYGGEDLTKKFADEIKGYSDEWAWAKARKNDGYYKDMHVEDYIPMVCSNGYVLNMQIAGMNTYTGYGDTPVGNHIDWISKELWNDLHPMNKVSYNNGNANSPSPFLASDLNYWLNSMSGSVPNSTTDPSVTVDVDYTAGGVLYYLPDKVKNQIIAKRVLLPSRYSEGNVLTDDNNWAWQNTGKLWIPSEFEVAGTTILGSGAYGACGFVQYPIFANNMNRAKIRCANKDRFTWWLLSAHDGDNSCFLLAYYNGNFDFYYANTDTWVSSPICFRI